MRLGLERHWMAMVPMSQTERLLSISVAEGMLFGQTDHGNFYTYDAESGRLLWSTMVGPQARVARPASANSKLVFVTNSYFLYALDRRTGRTAWKVDLATIPSSSTTCDEDKVMVGLSSGLLRAFHTEDRESKATPGHIVKGGSFAFNWQTNGPMTARPIAAGRLIAFGSHDGRAYVAQAEPPVMLYRFKTGGAVSASMGTYGERTLLVPSADQALYAIDLFTAEVKWTFSAGAPVVQEPLVSGDDVYVVNAAGILNLLDAPTGRLRWSTSTQGGRLIAVSATRVYLESHDDDLFIVDRATGRMIAGPRDTFQRAGLNLRHYELGPTNSLDDRLYFATNSGLVICLREKDQLQPRLLRDPKQKPFGYIPTEGIDLRPKAAPGPAAEPDATPKDEATPAAAPAEGVPAPEPK